jgi:serine protease Do
VDPKGYILTNYHVIERSGVIKVTLEDQSEYDAQIAGTDPKTDVALLKIDAGRPLPAGRLGDSDDLEIGEWVMAIGSPFGLSHTVTVGVVSAKGRVIGSGPLDDYIQTDAYINVGNSGGPLLNAKGEVVGINTAIVAESMGVGFALPINVAKAILQDLKTYGAPRRGWLGVSVRALTPEISKRLGLSGGEGVLVSKVAAAGPAAVAGVREGDVILAYNGRPVRASRELPRLVASTRPGSRARLKFLREGRQIEVGVFLRAVDDGWVTEDRAGRRLGFQVTRMNRALARRMGLHPPAGVVISMVEDGSSAQAAGLQEGDIILEVNRKPVRDLDRYKRLLQRAAEEESILLLVRRNRNSLFVALKPS